MATKSTGKPRETRKTSRKPQPPTVLKCSLGKCSQGKLHSNMARVEVKGFDLAQEERKKMQASWSEGGEAIFHDACWRIMVSGLKADNPDNNPVLGPREKALVEEARKTAEYFDSLEKVQSEGARIARMLKTSQHAITFTGAGISTSAGIGDYRGKSGKWTEQDRAKVHGRSKAQGGKQGVGYRNLRPTYTHEALCKLQQMGLLKYVISQNVDGLHRLSDIPRDKISEMHGNVFIERCEKCPARYERPYPVRGAGKASKVPPKVCDHCRINHRTGKKCERKGCDGCLMSTVINFGDPLEGEVLSSAEKHSQVNDLCLCLGTTLRVTPACDLVEMGRDPVRLVICNRQPTPFDKLCYNKAAGSEDPVGSRVFGDCDNLMREVMRNVLSEDELEDWEGSRGDRMDEYDTQRPA